MLAAPVEVSFQGDPSCGPSEFERGLSALLAGSTTDRQVRAVLSLTRDAGDRWTADLALETAGTRSTRSFTGASCLEVCEAAAFVTAIIVDPGVLDRPLPAPGASTDPGPPPILPDTPDAAASTDVIAAPPEASDTPPAPDPRPPPPAASPAPSVRARSRIGGFVRLAGGFEAIGMPRIGPQLALAAGIRDHAWRVELGAIYRAPTAVTAQADPKAGASIRMWALGARGCGVLHPGPLELGLCGGFEAGQAIGQGQGYLGSRGDAIPWAAATLGVPLSWAPRRWLALWLGVDLAVPVIRGSFTTAGLGELFKVGPVSLRGALGLELRFQ